MNLKRRISAALGREKCDLLLKNARVVSVFTGHVEGPVNVAIADGAIAGFGDYHAKKVIDLRGAYLTSGFVDSHMHLESTLLTPAEFARSVLPHGTTTVVCDPHELANVAGVDGIKYLLDASEKLPLDIYVALPSCVPASRLDTSGASLGAKELKKVSGHPRVIAIGEVMDWYGVIGMKKEMLEKLELKRGIRIDGHAPGLSGHLLNAYIMGNISSDHESTSAAEALEKLRSGLHIMIREGSAAKNLAELVKIVTPVNAHRLMLCTDDLHVDDIISHGHIDNILRKAVKAGVNPVTAVQMATNNPSYYFRFPAKKGAVAVGYQADLVVLNDLKDFRVKMVFKDGRLVARNGRLIVPCEAASVPKRLKNSVRTKKFSEASFKIRVCGERARIIKVNDGNLITDEEILRVNSKEGEVIADIGRDIIKLAVIERHFCSGRIGLGLIRGLGIKRGAVASSVAHDSHNLIVAGVSDRDMLLAAEAVLKAKGGYAVAENGRVTGLLPLPVAGLISDQKAGTVAAIHRKLAKAVKKLGSRLSDPLQMLSFMALPVIPELKLTDKGLVKVSVSKHVKLWE